MKSYQQLSNAQSFNDKPIIVIRSKLTSDRYDPPFVPAGIAQKMDSLFDNAEKSFKQLSNDLKVVYSTSEKHHLHIADRDLVVNSIKKLVE